MPEFAGLSDPDLRLDSVFDPAALVLDGWYDPDIIAGTLPITKTTSAPVEALAPNLAQTAGEWEEALQAITKTGDRPEESVQSVGTTDAAPAEALVGVAATQADPVEALAPNLAQTGVLPAEAEQALATTGSDPSETGVGLAATDGLVEESLQGLAATGSDPVESEQGVVAVSQTAVLPLDAVQGIAKTSGYVASAVKGIAATKALVASAVQAIRATAQTTMEALKVVADAATPPAFRDISVADGGAVNVNSIVIAKPALVQDGDLLIMFFRTSSASGTETISGGWTRKILQSNYQVWTKIASGEPSSYTISNLGFRIVNAACLAYSGTTGIETLVFADDGSRKNTHTTGSLTTLQANEGILLLTGNGDHRAVNNVSGSWTERLEALAPSSLLNLEAQDLLAVNAAGLKGPFQFSSSDAVQCQMFLISLVPPSAPTAKLALEASSGLTPTSGRATVVIDAVKAITATLIEGWEALQAVAKTASQPVDPGSAIARTSSEPVEALGGIAGTASEPLDATSSSVVATGSEPVEALQQIDVSGSEPWDSGGQLAATAGEPEESLEGLTKTGSEPWESAASVIITVTQTAAVVIDALGKLAVTKADPWSALQKLRALGTGIRWETAAPLVRQTASAAWEALRKLTKTAGEPVDTAGATLAVAVSLPVEAGKKIVTTTVESWESLEGVFALAPDPHDNPGPVFNNGFMVAESLVRVEKSETGAYEANQGIARTVAERIEATGALQKLGGLPIEALAPGVAQTTTAPFEVLVGARRFVALPLELLGGVAAVAVLPVNAEGIISSKGFAIGVVLPATQAHGELVPGSSSEITDVAGAAASSQTVAAAVAAARVIAATFSTIEDKEAGQP